MLEMFVANDVLNTTSIPTTIATVYEGSIETNNIVYNNYAAGMNASTSMAAVTVDANAAVNPTAAAFLTDVIMNTSAIVVDFASQWLTTTIATAVTNLSNPIDSNENAASVFNSTPKSIVSPCPISPLLFNSTRHLDGLAGSVDNLYDDYPPCHHDNPNFNCSVDEFIEFCLGPKTLPLYKALLVSMYIKLPF